MIELANPVNIKFVDVPVECYYPAFKKDETLPYEYYRKFLFNNNLYSVYDYAVVNGILDIEIVKLLCIFTTKDRKVQLVVRKYIFARNLRDRLKREGCTKFDDNEVVEDFTKDYIINPYGLLRKCQMVYGQRDENCIVTEYKLNPLSTFSCRYTLTLDGLFPKLPIPQLVLTEHNTGAQLKKLTTQKATTISFDEYSTDENTPEKMRSPRNLKNDKALSVDIAYSPTQRNSVKRNLNKSFGESPNKMGNSILNYSIVTDEEIDNSLVIKVKVSEKNKIPLVVLKKSDDNYYSTRLSLREKKEQLPARKSSRVKARKSYAEYISPIKLTPRKRTVSENSSEHEDSIGPEVSTPIKNCSNAKEKVPDERSETPVKVSPWNENISNKRFIRTPKRYQTGDCIQTSARRSLRLMSNEEVKETVLTRKETLGKSPGKRHQSTSPDKGEDTTSVVGTPEKRVNLDESIRRSILKVRLCKPEKEVEKNLNGKHQSRSAKKYFYDSSESENNEENTSEKNKRSVRLRTPRPRSNSATSSQEEQKLTTPRTRRRINYKDEPPSTRSTSKMKTPPPAKEPIPKTPKSSNTRTPKSSVKQTPKTPRNRAKLIREGIITPSMHSRTHAIVGDSTPLMKARSQLHVSYVPTALPCREKEYSDMFNFLEGKLLDGCGGCMYVSGVPGTGKTATVTAVVNNLLQSDDVLKFTYVSINGMRLTEPRQSYVEIWKQLTGKTVPWEQAQSMLEERFTKSNKHAPVIMVIDELDILCTKRQDVVYNLLDWPSKAKNQLIVVTIANTMDLPERLLMSRVTSRLGLTRLTFQAYTHKQLQEIVTKRLAGTDSFDPDAIQLVARKVASVSGDARRALDICRRAAEIAESEGKGQLVNMGHVSEALNAMITQVKVRAIKNCSRLERLLLQSIVAEVERTGVEETTFADVYKMLVSCAAIDGFRMVSSTVALSAVNRLSACRLILADQKCNDINQRIVLNVSTDDVYYALKKE